MPPGLGAPTEADAPDESQPEEILLDENKRKEEGKHSFYMVRACMHTHQQPDVVAGTAHTCVLA